LQEMIKEISKKFPEETPYPRQFNTSQPMWQPYLQTHSGLIVRGRFNGLTFPRDLPIQFVDGPGAVLKRRRSPK
jgi:hypothetical protein